jgi:hypothetical protein
MIMPRERSPAMGKRKKYVVKGRLGTGKRFKRLSAALERRGASSPAALAAWIGREKYGKARFQKLAVKGRRRSR